MTASTPMSVLGLDGTRVTGMPPPPQAMGRVCGQLLRSDLMASICRILVTGCHVIVCLLYFRTIQVVWRGMKHQVRNDSVNHSY